MQHHSLITNDELSQEGLCVKEEFLNFIKKFNLQDKHPQNLHLKDGLLIQQDLLSDKDGSFPYLVLQNIMMYNDYRPLCKLMSAKLNFKIHPIDILLVLLHCSENILRQDLLSRLFRCQLAIPFLLPDPIDGTTTALIWAMRSIVCEWKCKVGDTITSKQSSIVDYKAPTILFLRIGKAKSPKDFSKSRTLNTVIGDQNYFFHWNCPGGDFNRKFVNGLVELCCYLPSGKGNDKFSDAVYFVNLRGDSCQYIKQLNFLKKFAFMAFAVLLEENLSASSISLMKELSNLHGGLGVIFPNFDHVQMLQNSNCPLDFISKNNITPLNIRGENDDNIKSKIQKFISDKLANTDASKFISISECADFAQDIGIRVDEKIKECTEGYSLANKIIKMLDSVPASNTKMQLFPLQGPELWHKWASYDKEGYQTPNKADVTVAFHNQTIHHNKQDIRKLQYNEVMNPTILMKCFTESLQNENILVRNYFLHWLKLLLDKRSRKILPSIRAEYERIRGELQKLRTEGKLETHSDAKNITNKLKKQNKLLTDGSLGLEHFFRELGQTYEAVKDHNHLQSDVNCYPKIMVEILNQGFPVELMDGDASHVPIIWVSAILKELALHHSKKKVFVISVLGIQSTGKSTLLNTMFGLQFSVSAGRCTRGAFMQLLPIKNATCKNTCDFALIIDTEGLRAPELRFSELPLHDNELATFVIGLADVAIINISGETPGDLNDILQTAVHALIRMKNVSMDLSCHFVYQNVTDVLIDSKISFGQQCFQDQLDELTKYAAKAEHCESKYSTFQDVIKFDGKKDTTYFPGLWKGDPPMAPVNPGYCEKALQLKTSLLNHVDDKKSKSSFTNFQTRVLKLWQAVCSENYIFSFKSTQEVTAYNSLDREFSQWSWTLYRKMQKWQLATKNYISNCPFAQITSVVKDCLKKADVMLNETHTTLLQQMTNFFESSEEAETLAQWKGRYQIRLEHLKDDNRKEAKRLCELFKYRRECRLKLDNINDDHRQQLLKHIKRLVANAKQNNRTLTLQELQNKFDEKWQVWMSEFDYSNQEYQTMYASNQEIEVVLNEILQQLLTTYRSILVCKLGNFALLTTEDCEMSITIDPVRHVKSTSGKGDSKPGRFRKTISWMGFREDIDLDIVKLQCESDKLLIDAKHEMGKLKRNFLHFDRSHPFGLLKKFIDNLETYNKSNDYIATSDYIVDMALIYAKYMVNEFTKLMVEVRDTEDPVASFKKSRDTYFQTFLAQYRDVTGSEVVASHLSKVLSAAIGVAVKDNLPIDIVDQMKNNDPSFNHKNYFKVKILKDLAKERKFKLYKTYLVDIKSSFEYWAEHYVKDFCMANRKANLKKTTKLIIQKLILYIDTVIHGLDDTMPLKEWWEMFHERLNEKLKLDLGEMLDIIKATNAENSSSELLVNTISQKLKQIEEKLMKKIEDSNSEFSDITKWNASPHILLCDQLIGCTALCPFCKEQCELADSNHVASGKDHYIEIHRPQCLGKVKWNLTKELVLDLCTLSAESQSEFSNRDTHGKWVKYKDYKTVYKDWCITNENPNEAPKYWQWFIYHFQSDIKKWVGAKGSSVSKLNWKAVSREMAIASLSKIYNID